MKLLRRPRTPVAGYPSRACTAGFLIAAAGVALAGFLPEHTASPEGPAVSWVLLAVLFGIAEISVLHVQMRGGARTVSLSEAPLVLGLFFTAPPQLVLARLVGPLVVFAIIRRQSLLKLGVNMAVLLVEVGMAVELFRLVLGGASAASPRAWLAAYLAVLVSGVVSAVLVTLVIALFQDEFHLSDLTRAVSTSTAVSVVIGTIALVAVNALERSTGTGWLLAGAAAVILICYRAYAALTGRHAALARLYGFTDAISSTHEPDEVLRQLLLSAREIARAEHAEIVFAPALPEGMPTRLTIDENGRLQRNDASAGTGATTPGLQIPDPVHAQVLRTGTAILLPHRSGLSRRPDWRRYLRRVGRREALAVPLRDAQPLDGEHGQGPGRAGAAQTTGSLMVAGRVGQVHTFDAADLRLVETLANHAGLALRNGWLINGLTHAVRHDALTGLVNRSYLHQQLTDVLAEIRSGDRPGAAVMICDLNGFKDVNDALGHQMGDVLLQEVARRASAALAPGDVLARLGGDEFAILLPNALTAEAAADAGERVLRAIAEPVALADLVISVGMSIGVALAPRHGVEASGLLKRADMAMYAAKATNRGLRLWESGMGQTDAQQLTFAGELRCALAGGDLGIYAEPIASLITGEVVSVEVLPRWQHPERGLLMPEEFVPTAANSGLASELARYLLGAAISSCAEWRRINGDLGVSVNLPARALADTTLPETVARMLETHGLPAERLTLEIAESSVVAEDSRTLPGLRQLSSLGVRVAVDGFGTGHTSLTHLRRMPVRQVKIDAGFVRRIDHDRSDEAIVRSIVDLGAKLGLDVVAEGVDRQAVWEQLRRMGCGQAQGALLARPIRLAAFAEWLRDDDPSPRRLLGSQKVSLGGPRAALELGTRDPLRGQAS
jgi:diguanylate cyclase (GGDEF)-like protein